MLGSFFLWCVLPDSVWEGTVRVEEWSWSKQMWGRPCWPCRDIADLHSGYVSVVSLPLFNVQPDFLSYTIFLSLLFHDLFTCFILLILRVNFSILPFNLPFSSIHILFAPYTHTHTICLLFTFPVSLLPVLAGPQGMSHSQRINVKESAHREHVHSSQVDGQSTQSWGLPQPGLFNLKHSRCYWSTSYSLRMFLCSKVICFVWRIFFNLIY